MSITEYLAFLKTVEGVLANDVPETVDPGKAQELQPIRDAIAPLERRPRSRSRERSHERRRRRSRRRSRSRSPDAPPDDVGSGVG